MVFQVNTSSQEAKSYLVLERGGSSVVLGLNAECGTTQGKGNFIPLTLCRVMQQLSQ